MSLCARKEGDKVKPQEPQELIKLLLQFGSFLLALLTFIALIIAKVR